MKIYHLLCVAGLFSLTVFTARAQDQQATAQQEQEKRIEEYIENRVQRLTELLNLEYWQEFYVDSTLRHDVPAMMEEQLKMQAAKVENRDLFQAVEDKWQQQIDDSYKRFFTEEQWKKYWKSGAERAWKARQKRKK